MGCRSRTLAFECSRDTARSPRVRLAISRFRLLHSWPRRQLDSGLSRFGEPDGDSLFRRSRAVLPLADMFDLLAHVLAGLRGGRFTPSGAGVCSPFRHNYNPLPHGRVSTLRRYFLLGSVPFFSCCIKTTSRTDNLQVCGQRPGRHENAQYSKNIAAEGGRILAAPDWGRTVNLSQRVHSGQSRGLYPRKKASVLRFTLGEPGGSAV